MDVGPIIIAPTYVALAIQAVLLPTVYALLDFRTNKILKEHNDDQHAHASLKVLETLDEEMRRLSDAINKLAISIASQAAR